MPVAMAGRPWRKNGTSAPRESASRRNALDQLDGNVLGRDGGIVGQGTIERQNGFQGQILLVAWNPGIRATHYVVRRAHAKNQRIVQPDATHQGAQLVVSIIPATENLKKEIDFGRRADFHEC